MYADGTRRRCYNCEAVKHFASIYPHQDEKPEEYTVHITLLTSKPDAVQKNLLVESLGKGLLDSGCTKTVTGEQWLEEYCSTLCDADKMKVVEKSSKSLFRFGYGVESKSVRKVTIPVNIGRKDMLMDVKVVCYEYDSAVNKQSCDEADRNEDRLC